MPRDEESQHAAVVVGAVGGLIAGYVLWLVGITVGDDITTVSKWSLAVLMASGALAVAALVSGPLLRWRRKQGWAAFVFALPVLPVVLSLALLANIYL